MSSPRPQVQPDDEDSVQEYHVERDEDGEMTSRTRIPRTPLSAKRVDFSETVEDIVTFVEVLENQLRQRRESESLVAFPENGKSKSALRANSTFNTEIFPEETLSAKSSKEDDNKPSKRCGGCALV